MYPIKDQVFFITGGAAGIGSLLVRTCLNEGAKYVAALDVDISNGEALETELATKYGPNKIKFYKCDVTTEDLNACYDNVIKELGYIDVVINCAGILNDSRKMYMKAVAVNVSALIASSVIAYDLMRKDKGGRGGAIINISSMAGLVQSGYSPIYATTKTAVLQFSTCLGMEPNYSRSGVRVLAMCFGCTDTTLLQPGKLQAFDDDDNDEIFEILRQMPWQTPDAAARGVLEAYQKGSSGTTWLITSSKPAKDITNDIADAFKCMSRSTHE